MLFENERPTDKNHIIKVEEEEEEKRTRKNQILSTIDRQKFWNYLLFVYKNIFVSFGDEIVAQLFNLSQYNICSEHDILIVLNQLDWISLCVWYSTKSTKWLKKSYINSHEDNLYFGYYFFQKNVSRRRDHEIGFTHQRGEDGDTISRIAHVFTFIFVYAMAIAVHIFNCIDRMVNCGCFANGQFIKWCYWIETFQDMNLRWMNEWCIVFNSILAAYK